MGKDITIVVVMKVHPDTDSDFPNMLVYNSYAHPNGIIRHDTGDCSWLEPLWWAQC